MHCFVFVIPKGVFNTSSSNTCNQSPSNGREVITLRPNKQRTKKSKNPFGSCSLFWNWPQRLTWVCEIRSTTLTDQSFFQLGTPTCYCGNDPVLTLKWVVPLTHPPPSVIRARRPLHVVIALSKSSSSSRRFSGGWFADYFAPYFLTVNNMVSTLLTTLHTNAQKSRGDSLWRKYFCTNHSSVDTVPKCALFEL